MQPDLVKVDEDDVMIDPETQTPDDTLNLGEGMQYNNKGMCP